MMSKTVKLGEICELAYGKALEKCDRLESGGFPAFGANGIKTIAKKSMCDQPSIIIGRKGSAGEIKKVSEPFWALDVTYYTKFDKNLVDLDFLYFTLKSLNLPAMARGVKPGINRNDVYTKEVFLPSLEEQQRIVAKLDAAFAKIDEAISSTQEMLSSISKMKASIVKYAQANESLGWSQSKLPEISKNLDSLRKPITKSQRTKGDTPYYGASGVVDHVEGHIFDEDLLLVSEDGANLIARTYPIAFSITGKTWVNNHAHVLRFENSLIQRWVELYLNAKDLAPYISGMAQPKLNQQKLNQIKISLPANEFLEGLISTINNAFISIDRLNSLQSEKLENLMALRMAVMSHELTAKTA